jgi:proline racemase
MIRSTRLVTVVDSHTAGEPTRMITAGYPSLPGRTLREKQDSLFRLWPGVIAMTVGEPRGHAATHATLPLPPVSPGTDLALLIFSALGPLTMCGHALIGTVTTLLQTGAITPVEPVTALVVETMAGLVTVNAHVEDGDVRSVTFRNAPAFVLLRDVSVSKTVTTNIAYGGLWYAIVDAAAACVPVDFGHVHELVRASAAIRMRLNRDLPEIIAGAGLHPGVPVPDAIPQVLFTEGSTNLATSTGLGFDRSPCGTGTCARLALMYARGELGAGQPVTFRGIAGDGFTGEITAVSGTEEDGVPRVTPQVTGSAWITGFTQQTFSPADPLRAGFLVPAADERPVGAPLSHDWNLDA